MQPFQWECPFCRNKQIATKENAHNHFQHLAVGKTNQGAVGLLTRAIRCQNDACNELYLVVELRVSLLSDFGYTFGRLVTAKWALCPESLAKPQPEYIPAPLREDYYEACLIRDKSPKASATLARRCLQGMIRDFCGITK